MKELMEKKLRADEIAVTLGVEQGGTLYDYANALDREIFRLEERLKQLREVYEVYQGFVERGLSTREELSEALCDYALSLGKAGGDGYHVLELLYSAAADGSHKAVIEYAGVLAYGRYGVSPCLQEAVDWLERYADKGDAEACYSLTALHFDFPEAIEAQRAYELCQKAASMGYPPAIRRLSLPFDLRSYTQKLEEKAQKGDESVYFALSQRKDLPPEEQERYLQLALEREDPRAQLFCADALKARGELEQARIYYEKAGSNGCAEAYLQLAALAVPEGGEPFYDYSKLDVTLLPLPYHTAQYEAYRKAAELGNTQAMVYLGIACRQGYPVAADPEKAYGYFAKATELGDEYLAAFCLAQCYEKGLGVDFDEQAALMYYAMSAQRGNVSAMLSLARIYENGLGSIPKDPKRAREYLFMSGTGRD